MGTNNVFATINGHVVGSLVACHFLSENNEGPFEAASTWKCIPCFSEKSARSTIVNGSCLCCTSDTSQLP